MKFEFNFLSVMMRVEAVTMTFKYSRWDSLCQDVDWLCGMDSEHYQLKS